MHVCNVFNTRLPCVFQVTCQEEALGVRVKVKLVSSLKLKKLVLRWEELLLFVNGILTLVFNFKEPVCILHDYSLGEAGGWLAGGRPAEHSLGCSWPCVQQRSGGNRQNQELPHACSQWLGLTGDRASALRFVTENWSRTSCRCAWRTVDQVQLRCLHVLSMPGSFAWFWCSCSGTWNAWEAFGALVCVDMKSFTSASAGAVCTKIH